MESRAKLFGHLIHPMLIVFPLGLLGMPSSSISSPPSPASQRLPGPRT
jgi:hypothetical protein